ncbi:MAG TPA: tail fiber protein [Candidatus Acidoferrales bacterium]|nr:tail fiber protein [Candidatus Acidoferrales bacterium]
MARYVLAPNRPDLPVAEAPDPERRGFLSRVLFAAGGILIGAAGKSAAAPQSTESTTPWVGEIAIVPFGFAPTGWALCNGQLLSISLNQALFSLIGTTFGGDGQSTFALPNLQARVPMHIGPGYVLGQSGGESTHTLAATEIPAHTHSIPATSLNGTSDSPAGLYAAMNPAGIPLFGAANGTLMGPTASTGGSVAHNNLQPYLVLNFVISLTGTFPTHS